jgi:hypothetical protein
VTARTVVPDKRARLQSVLGSLLLPYFDEPRYTLAEREKGVLWPVTEEPLWHELVRILPVPCYEDP